MKRLALAILLACSQLAASDWYASPCGSATGSGTLDAPFDLVTALGSAAVQPGDTVYLRGGRYARVGYSHADSSDVVWPVTINGNASSQVTIRPYQHERVILDGSRLGQTPRLCDVLYVPSAGGYVTLRDLEITNSDPTGRMGATNDRGTGIFINSTGCKLINLTVSDCGAGIHAFSNAPDTEVYGCISFNNGTYKGSLSQPSGHGIYIQNNSGTKTVTDSMFFHNANFQVHQYGSSASYSRNISWIGDVVWSGRCLWGGDAPVVGLLVRDFFLFGRSDQGYYARASASFGYGTWDNQDGLVESSQLYGNVFMPRSWDAFTFRNNNVGGSGADQVELMLATTDQATTEIIADGNRYFTRSLNQKFKHQIRNGLGSLINFAEWQDRGWDQNGAYFPNPASLTGAQAFVRPNLYDSSRANVIIYNWSQAPQVAVDVSSLHVSGLGLGTPFTLIAAQDYFGDRLTGTYDGSGSILFPMTGHTVALPVGLPLPAWPDTFPRFGAFIIKWGCN